MPLPKIKHVRAPVTSGADYHDKQGYHWIDDHVATPMARYPLSRQQAVVRRQRTRYPVVEIDADTGEVGFAVTTAGEIGPFIVEKHLARFLEGRPVIDLEKMWDQIYAATIDYGRGGIVLNAISAVDLALWDLRGKLRQEPVMAVLGGPVRDELQFYATGARPDLAKQMGFIGGKMPSSMAPRRARRA